LIETDCTQYVIKEFDFILKLKFDGGLVKIENEKNLSHG